MIFAPDILQTLSYQRGETSVPQTATAQRTEFIQRTLDEIYESYEWKFSEVNATVAVVNGIAALPSGLSMSHQLNLSYLSNGVTPATEVELNQINLNDRYKALAGQRKYWLTSDGDGTFSANLLEPASVLLVHGYLAAPTINATIGTPFPDRMTIALGANRWVIRAQNPEADISQDEDLYQNRLADNIAGEQHVQPRRHMRGIQEEHGYGTGDL